MVDSARVMMVPSTLTVSSETADFGFFGGHGFRFLAAGRTTIKSRRASGAV